MRVGLITLGCDKNTVDNEYLAGLLESRGCEVFDSTAVDLQSVDAVVVTTCGFIGDAKLQSVETLAGLADSKRDTGFPKRLFVAGCLAQRYADDILAELPEIDGLVGVGQFEELTNLIVNMPGNNGHDLGSRQLVRSEPTVHVEHFMVRKHTSGKPHAFLKVSDGCNNGCTFCSIPMMKGKHRSVPIPILLQEARSLLDQGVKELILVAQDLSAYGKDIDQETRLPHLLKELVALEGDFWIRCMYCYPGGITDSFVDLLANEPKIVPYLDVPLQHLDRGVLKRMKRPAREVNTVELVSRLRERVPGIALRTSMIVGFPGETEEEHEEMLVQMRQLKFDWLGAFQYSPEEGTPAGDAPGQIPDRVKQRRWHRVMQTQAELTKQKLQQRTGQQMQVLIEEYDDFEELWIGRSPLEAPEVDGSIFVESDTALHIGDFVTVESLEVQDDYDLLTRAME